MALSGRYQLSQEKGICGHVKPYVMGIDFGTESVRVGIFTADGVPVIFRSQSYKLSHPRRGGLNSRR